VAELLDRTTPQHPPTPTPAAAPSTGVPPTAPPAGELRALQAVQRAIAVPPVVRVARAMSLFGEHAGGWLALGVLGALADRPRRRDWLTATAAVALAHGASIGVKRVVRRNRPDHPQVRVLAGTPSRLSFPSAHASSTTAAAVLFGGLLRRPLVAALVPPMALSRLVLGVHYPSDVLAGSVLGAAVAALARGRTPALRKVAR
jgi:membrane-associated phospholipid phosphatase